MGMTEGWGGNDMREEEEITPPFLLRDCHGRYSILIEYRPRNDNISHIF